MKVATVALFAVVNLGLISQNLIAGDSVVVGSVRVQCLSSNLVRLEVMGPEGFEDRPTFHVVSRDWPGTASTTNLGAGQVLISTPNYTVHVPSGATSLSGIYLTSPGGQTNFTYDGSLNNSVWLPGPAEKPASWSFADSPRLMPPGWGITPAPPGAPLASTSGWDTNNDAPDVYVFVPNGSYQQLRSDFLKLTGHTGMIPLWAFGCWDSRWYDYTESTALDQIAAYRSRSIPLDALVCDTGWRVNASTGYQPNSNFFPDMPRFLSEAHAANVRVMFNDHPEPVAANALDPVEVTYRYTNLTQLLGEGLDVWWYDRNWGVSLLSPSPNLRHEVWGMRVYHDATDATNASLRPMIMANIDGIDNGVRNRPMNVAAHTYPIQWTGDIGPSSTYLRYAVQNAVHSGVQALFPYESDDLGGHTSNPTPEGYIRWIEYGALSPIYRPHCTYNLTRMPWTFGPEAEWTARRLLNLRYRLLPVFYAAAHENYETGEPLLRRLDLDYPQYADASREDQYLIGHSLLVAPMIDSGATTIPSSWLTTTNGQPGLNAAYFSSTNLSGAPTLTRVDPNLDFNWNSGSPGGSVPAQNFTVRWIGNLTIPPGAGDVHLAALSDDGVRVWVDNQLCIDNWGPNDSVTTTSSSILKAGQTCSLRLEYLQLGGKDVIALQSLGANPSRTLWVPPGKWINAWTGATVNGPATAAVDAPLGQIPLFIRSGSIFALAPQMEYTGQLPWDPVTLDVYPSTTETDQTTLYEDDTLTTAYQAGQFRTTTLKTWADDAAKTVSVAIAPAAGTFTGALTQRSWVARLHRPPHWPDDLAPAQVTLNGQPIGPVMRRVKNTTAMPLGAANGAPDADVFEVTLPESSVLTSNVLVATFASASSPWTSGDIGCVGASGNVIEGASTSSNAVWLVRGGGAGIGGTNDGFHYLYQPCVSNAQLVVRLTGQPSASAGAEAGILFSEGLDATARNAVIALTADNHLVFQSRSTAGAAAQTTTISGFTAPCWLRLLRTGDSFIAYASTSGAQWTQVAAVSIPGFNAQAYVGLAVTAAIAATNAVDDTHYNQAVFSNLTLNNTVGISTVPNQTTAASTPTPAIPFTVSSTGGNPLTVIASSSNTNLLTTQNIVIDGTGAGRTVTLTPSPGGTGRSTVTLTVTDGANTASAQFSLTVFPASGWAAGQILLEDNFGNYAAGNLPGTAFHGTGFATGGSWLGLDNAFGASVSDAATVSFPGLTSPLLHSSGGTVTVKGDGSNLEALPDLSAGGPFADAGLLDSASGTIGGGNISGTLYLRFLIRAHFDTGNGAYGGLQLSRSDDTTGVLIGNSSSAWAFSLWSPATSTSADLVNHSGNYLFVDAQVHLLVARIDYHANADDTLTVWLDPDTTAGENSQSSATTYLGGVSGDFSFDRFFLRGGYSGKQFDYGAIGLGTSWSAVVPTAPAPEVPAPAVQGAGLSGSREFNFCFSGAAGQSYSILASTNLALPLADWTVERTGTFGFDPVSLNWAIPSDDLRRFFRISIP
ncbi:MAG TPA: TIM-barrel domain-containing protein [Verrucomicrobiae bacterium]|nr:TIM-barrel domain-containing protein [Verrucomicrobiae bacterium]